MALLIEKDLQPPTQQTHTVACSVTCGTGRGTRGRLGRAGDQPPARRRRHRFAASLRPALGLTRRQRIRLTGRGHAGEGGGSAGDLLVLVHVTADERFLRDGSDLISVVDVQAPSAALGTEVTVPTLAGEETVKVPAGTQPGTVVTLGGRGMPDVGHGRAGDQQVVLNVVVPRNLTPRQRELMAELRDSVTHDNMSEAASESLLSKVRRALR